MKLKLFRLSENTTRRITRILCYLDLVCLISMLEVHVLSFFGLGIFPFEFWMALTPIVIYLYLVAADYETTTAQWFRKNYPIKRDALRTLADYPRDSNFTMPHSPYWLIRIVRPAFWLQFPYVFIQIYLLLINFPVGPTGPDAMLARLFVPSLIWLCLFSLPVLYSNSKKV
jgi:hypothetical protein